MIIGMSDGINLSFLFIAFRPRDCINLSCYSPCPFCQNILVSVAFFARKLAPSKIITLISELASPTAEAKLYCAFRSPFR